MSIETENDIPIWRRLLPFPIDKFSTRNKKKFDPTKHPKDQFTPEQMMRIDNAVHATKIIMGGKGTGEMSVDE